MKLFFSLFLLTIFGFAPGKFAQTEPDQFIADLQAFYKTVNTLQADFTQRKHSALFTDALISEGEFLFAKPEKIRWEQQVPTANYFIINGDNFIQFNGEKREENGPGKMQMTFFKKMILGTLDGSILQDDNFEQTFESTKTQTKITLIPKNKRIQKRVAHVDLWFNNETLLLQRMTIFESENDFTEMLFSNQQVNKNINPEKFN